MCHVDDENSLTLWERNDGNLDQSWTLDDVGNWNSFTENTSTQNRTHGNAHELTAIDSTSLTYDVKGNLTANANNQTYAWDSDNMLSSATVPSGSVGTVGTHSYEYDALGRRVAKVVTDSGITTTNLFIQRTNSITYSPFAGQVLAEYEFTTGSPTVSRKFVYGDYIDEPVAMVSINGSSESTYYYHRNQQYSITALSDSSGSVVERYAYDAYGNTTVFSGSAVVITTTAYDNPFTYTGRRFDTETGLMYFRARMYDLALSKYIGRDPLVYSSGPNLYQSYLTVNGVDPSGRIETNTGGPTISGENKNCKITSKSPVETYKGGQFVIPTAIPFFSVTVQGFVGLYGTISKSECLKCCSDGRSVTDETYSMSATLSATVSVIYGGTINREWGWTIRILWCECILGYYNCRKCRAIDRSM